MPFFKKTAHNRCSVALCAVLIPILTFSLGANLVTLHCEPVRTLAWQSPRFSDRSFCGLGPPTQPGDCHTSDTGHWFAMTAFLNSPVFVPAPGKGEAFLFECFCNGPASQYQIALVQHHGLAGGDSSEGTFEFHPGNPFFLRIHPGGGLRLAVADLGGAALG